ncbi:hypothetical protein [Escherichia coli]|uniref:hypothetical protein n=1 Tax=Escherichia coli TaxID=562 RepID=UPI00208DC513|nr:hypothetical protein [Escherichia coli]
MAASPNKWKDNPGEYELDKDYSHRRIYSADTVAFISTEENAREAGLRRVAMKIPSGHYHEINKIRDEILMEAEDELKNNQIHYEVVLDGNMKVILSETPYGTVLFWPLTKKIQRNCYMIDGDVQVYVHYLRWLILQWENRNPDINCVATTC